MLTGIESIFSTSVGFSLGLPPGSRCNIAEIPRPLLEGCKLRSPSFSIKTPTMSFLWGLNTFPVQNLVAMWISWFWHLRFPTQPVSGIYPFVVQEVATMRAPRDSQSLLNAAINYFPRELLLRCFFPKLHVPSGLLAYFLTFSSSLNSLFCTTSRWLSSF